MAIKAYTAYSKVMLRASERNVTDVDIEGTDGIDEPAGIAARLCIRELDTDVAFAGETAFSDPEDFPF